MSANAMQALPVALGLPLAIGLQFRADRTSWAETIRLALRGPLACRSWPPILVNVSSVYC